MKVSTSVQSLSWRQGGHTKILMIILFVAVRHSRHTDWCRSAARESASELGCFLGAKQFTVTTREARFLNAGGYKSGKRGAGAAHTPHSSIFDSLSER
jgi:hypothetical protein